MSEFEFRLITSIMEVFVGKNEDLRMSDSGTVGSKNKPNAW